MGSGSSRRRGAAGRGTGQRGPRGTAPAQGEEEEAASPGPACGAPPAAGSSPPARDSGSSPPARDSGSSPPARDSGSSPPARDTGSSPPARDSGSSPPARDSGGSRPRPPALSPRSPPDPENNTTDHQCPQRNNKQSTGKSTISYDYSEEELMASIEREYCR